MTLLFLGAFVALVVVLMVANTHVQEHVMDDFLAKYEALPSDQKPYATAMAGWFDSKDRNITMNIPFGALYLYFKRGLWKPVAPDPEM